MSSFARTHTILDKILARKVEEIAQRQAAISFGSMMWKTRNLSFDDPPRDFVGAIHAANARGCVALIAEIKKASPSKGILIEDFDPVRLGDTYARSGAACISVLTDEPFFMGHLRYLGEVRGATTVPLLRKDFIIDPYQVYEARAAGADAVLLIVAALREHQLAELHRLIRDLGMAALVEVHDEAELDRALKVGATLIGVNNRDLRTFREDLETTGRLAKQVPDDVLLVAESALRSAADVRRMGGMGAHAALVGEALVKADNIAQQIRDFCSQPRGDHDQGEDLRADDIQ